MCEKQRERDSVGDWIVVERVERELVLYNKITWSSMGFVSFKACLGGRR